MIRGMLSSWNDAPTRGAIVEFVERVTTEGGPGHLAAGAEKSLEQAAVEGWTVISIKKDSSTVFADS